MEHYFGVAKEQGLSDDEIGAVQSIVMAVSARSKLDKITYDYLCLSWKNKFPNEEFP
jgi:hypothetical protein